MPFEGLDPVGALLMTRPFQPLTQRLLLRYEELLAHIFIGLESLFACLQM